MTLHSPGHRSWIFWKLHRANLKLSPFWRRVELPGVKALEARYLAEGKWNYVFVLRRDPRLLKVTRQQFYEPHVAVDGELIAANCVLMNKLASYNLSVPAQHYVGGACFVERGGTRLRAAEGLAATEIDRVFKALEEWSLCYRTVILDVNEDNWCWDGQHLRIVDADTRYSCALEEAPQHPLVRKRISSHDSSPEVVLRAFLAAERRLLQQNLGLRVASPA